MNKIKISRTMTIMLTLALIGGIGVVWAIEAATINNLTPWTTTASSGTVDEADLNMAHFSGPYATVSYLGTLNIRYNIVAIPGLEWGDGQLMTVRFKDTGSDSNVLVRLHQYNSETGTDTVLWTFNSNDYESSGSYQTRTIASCGWSWGYDFNTNAYYIEANIVRSAYSANPGLASIELGGTLC